MSDSQLFVNRLGEGSAFQFNRILLDVLDCSPTVCDWVAHGGRGSIPCAVRTLLDRSIQTARSDLLLAYLRCMANTAAEYPGRETVQTARAGGDSFPLLPGPSSCWWVCMDHIGRSLPAVPGNWNILYDNWMMEYTVPIHGVSGYAIVALLFMAHRQSLRYLYPRESHKGRRSRNSIAFLTRHKAVTRPEALKASVEFLHTIRFNRPDSLSMD